MKKQATISGELVRVGLKDGQNCLLIHTTEEQLRALNTAFPLYRDARITFEWEDGKPEPEEKP